jgi:hypothetical protein
VTAESLAAIRATMAADLGTIYFSHAFIPVDPKLMVSPNEARKLAFGDGFRKACSPGRLVENRYNDHAATIRMLARAYCRNMQRPTGLVDMTVVVWPGRPWDDDAWHVLAKWAVDGMVDAGLWARDRRVIRWQHGRVQRDDGHATGIYVALTGVSDA